MRTVVVYCTWEEVEVLGAGKDGLNSFPCALLRHFDVLLLDFRQPQQNGGGPLKSTHFRPPHATQKVASMKK